MTNQYYWETRAREQQQIAFNFDARIAELKLGQAFLARGFERLAHKHAVEADRCYRNAKRVGYQLRSRYNYS